MKRKSKTELLPEISVCLKDIPEQQAVTGPLVGYLLSIGWRLEQLVFGKKEWRIPKSPSEATNPTFQEKTGNSSIA